MYKTLSKLLFISCICIANSLFSQEYISIKYGGARVFSSNTIPYSGPNICYLHPINESATVGLNIGYYYGDNNANMINLEPRIDMFTEQYSGFYLGSNIGFSKETLPVGGASNIYLGLRFGFAFTLSDRVVIDFSNGSSYNIGLSGSSRSGFQIQPTLGLGFIFGTLTN